MPRAAHDSPTELSVSPSRAKSRRVFVAAAYPF